MSGALRSTEIGQVGVNGQNFTVFSFKDPGILSQVPDGSPACSGLVGLDNSHEILGRQNLRHRPGKVQLFSGVEIDGVVFHAFSVR